MSTIDLGFYPEDKFAVFIDGANLYGATKALEFDVDYKKLLDFLKDQGTLIRAYYYTAIIEDQEYSPLRPLVDWLDYNGYTIVTKPAKEYTDQQGRRRVKGNMDVEIAVDVMELAPHVDQILLFSGDGDFRRLIESVQQKGVRVSVVSTIKSQPPMLADELRRQADTFVELSGLSGIIGRPQRERPAPDTSGGDDYDDDFEDEDDVATVS